MVSEELRYGLRTKHMGIHSQVQYTRSQVQHYMCTLGIC